MRRLYGRIGFEALAVSVLLAGCAPNPKMAAKDALPVAAPSGPPAYTVFFDLNSNAITADAVKILERTVADYRQLAGVRLVLAGHADRSGAERYNRGLSQQRAAAVRDHLVNAGIAPDAIHVEAYGERQGLVGTTDGAVEPQNRRVELFVRPN